MFWVHFDGPFLTFDCLMLSYPNGGVETFAGLYIGEGYLIHVAV